MKNKVIPLALILTWCSFLDAASLTPRQRNPRQTSFLSGIINVLLRSSAEHAHIQNTADLGAKCGYTVEEHRVTTEDGYILTMHHIPPFANSARRGAPVRKNHFDPYANKTQGYDDAFGAGISKDQRDEVPEDFDSTPINRKERRSEPLLTRTEGSKVVFLQHGLMGSSDNWNTNTPQDSLAYLLSDAGYDVWMGNFRGNIYSRQHLNLSHEDPEFWRFSYDEMARYDLPAMLDHVLESTGVDKILYVGHSMGTTVFFAMMSSQPEYYQERVAAMVALAPVATVTSITSPIKYFAPLVNELHFVLRLFGNDQELLTNRLLISLWDPYRVCGSNVFCENLQFMITGFDPSRADTAMVPVILSHNPAGSSTQTLFHFAQGYRSGRFQQFDLGRKENLKKYGQQLPPAYDVGKIKVPITLFWADNDWLTGEKDVQHLVKTLPHLKASYKVPNPNFSHLDFLWARDARSLVYEKVFDILEEAAKDL